MIARFALLLVACVALVASVQVSTSAQRAVPAPASAKVEARTLRISYPATETPSLDPHQIRDPLSFRLVGTAYETLYMYAPTGIVPCLAKDFPAVSEDGLALTIKLDTAAMFHSSVCFPDRKGRNLKASDVVHSFKRLAACGEQGMFWMADGLIEGLDEYGEKAAFEMNYETSETEVAGLKATDDSTLVIKLTRPCGSLVAMLAHPCFSIIPREAMDHFGSMLHGRAVGTGPYRLNAVAEDRLYVFKRWDDYRGGKAAFERVTFSQRTYWNEFLDDYTGGTLHEMPMWPAYYDRVALDGKPAGVLKDTATEIIEQADHGYYFLSFNMDDELWGAMDADGRALRRAVSLCLDRETALSNAKWPLRWNEGQANLLPAGLEFEEAGPTLDYGKFDADLAKKTLDGCKYKGGVDPATGKALTLKFAFPKADLYNEIANSLREGLRPLGIKLQISYADNESYRDDVTTSDDHLFVSGWFLDYADPFNFLQLFWSANAATGSEFNNTARYRSEAFDKLFVEYERLQATEKNRARRGELVAAMAGEISADQPTIPVCRRRYAKVRSTTIEWPDVARQSFHDIRFTKEKK
jgi:oligopeptide transport system substrate-binding protein